MNWALQLNNSQSVKLFESLAEKFNTQRSPNQPNQSQNQSVIDQDNLITRNVCLLSKVKRPVPMRSMKKVFTENSVLQFDQGNLIICLKTPVLMSKTAPVHTVKEQVAPEENRDIAFFNTDNEFNRAINEEDMDFKIPGLPQSVVKHAQSTSVRNLIQKTENHPDRHALQQDLRQNQSFNRFSPESKEMIQDGGNIELCELLEMQTKTQCKSRLSYWNIGIVY